MFSEQRNMALKGQSPKYVDIGALRSLSPAGQTNSQVDASQRKFAKPELAYGLAKGGQTDSQVDASQRKFAKPELANGLVKGGQMDSQISSQVEKSRQFHAYYWLMCFYNNRLLAINLCGLAVGGRTVKTLRPLASKFELAVASRCKSTRVGGQTKRKFNASPKLASTCESVRPELYRQFSFVVVVVVVLY